MLLLTPRVAAIVVTNSCCYCGGVLLVIVVVVVVVVVVVALPLWCYPRAVHHLLSCILTEVCLVSGLRLRDVVRCAGYLVRYAWKSHKVSIQRKINKSLKVAE